LIFHRYVNPEHVHVRARARVCVCVCEIEISIIFSTKVEGNFEWRFVERAWKLGLVPPSSDFRLCYAFYLAGWCIFEQFATIRRALVR